MLYCAWFSLFAEIERSRSSSEAFRRRLCLGAGVFLLNLRYGGKTDEKADEHDDGTPMVALEHGDYDEAQNHPVESLTLLQELGERWQTAHTLEVFASLAARQEKPNLLRAARLFGAAEVFRETLSAPVLPFQRHLNERGVASLRAQLDEAALVAAWAKGGAMTLEQAVEHALSE